MKATEIYELIKKLENSDIENFPVQIIGLGYINMTRQEVVNRLYSEYCELRLRDFANELKDLKVSQKQIAERLGIIPVTFNQMLSGFIKTNKTVGDSLTFIDKSRKIALELCNK